MTRKKNLRAAAETTHTAAKRRDAAERAAQAVSDYAQTFSPYLEQGRERIQPLLDQAQDRLHPYLEQAQDAVTPYLEQAQGKLEQAQDKIGPLAKQARTEGAKRVNQVVKSATPVINDTLDKVSPAVDSAREKVQSDLLPRLQDALDAAAGTELGKKAVKAQQKAAKKSGKALARQEKSHTGLKTFGALSLAAGLAAVAFVVVKKVLGANPQDDPWKAYEPSSPFAKPSTEDDPVAATPATEQAAGEATGEATTAGQPPVSGQAQAETFDRLEPDTDPTEGVEERAVSATAGYGEGSYVGTEPPEGFTIKGNERSMKYHTSDSSGFDRTIADVWFSSEEAAQAAGFSKAQR